MSTRTNATKANLLYVASEIERMGEELSLPQTVSELGVRLYIQALEADYRPSTIDRVTATCLYMAAKGMGEAVTIDQVAEVSRRKAKHIYSESNSLSTEINYPVELDDPSTFVEDWGAELGWDEEVIEGAVELCERIKEQGIHSGYSPSGVAAGVLYAYSRSEGLDHTQVEIADLAEVTEVTVRNNYPRILRHADDVNPKALANRNLEVAFDLIEDNFDLPNSVCQRARELAEEVTSSEDSGWSKAAIASGAYLTAANEADVNLDRSSLSDVTGSGEGTIAKYEEVM